jgi:hypothetical protein
MRTVKNAVPWTIALWATAAVGCSEPVTMRIPAPEIDGLQAPTPIIEGSEVRVTGIRFEALGPEPTLVLDDIYVLPLARQGEGAGELFFSATREVVVSLDGEDRSFAAVIAGDVDSVPYSATLAFASTVELSLSEVPAGAVSRNENAVLRGTGFLSPEEGEVLARFEGTFTPEDGTPRPASGTLPVLPAERFARDRGLLRLTTAFGGLDPGTFDGTLSLESTTVHGDEQETAPAALVLVFGRPELFALEPAAASLEQIVRVRGAGFVGDPAEPDEATVMRLDGMFTPPVGTPYALGPAELVLAYVSGSEMRGVLSAEVRSGDLVSSLFGARRGTFRGQATPVVIKGVEELAGATIPFGFELDQVRQVVWLRFLAPFYDSLTRFGLASSAGIFEGLVEERIESIYDGWLVDVRLERPDDFSANGYATIDIGGPDPNGLGLFGYDNTPGKDVGNLRLFDTIGGANALTLEDGSPGYGGVFVESMLFFSSHPDLPAGASAAGRPDPDPLFDEIFDPVRAEPATRAEIMGEGAAARVASVDRALRALAAMVGETAAHELGHSLGLAQPYGSRTAFHSPFDSEGCLMDSGGSRPIGERTAQPGFAETRLCHDEPDYLDEILGR